MVIIIIRERARGNRQGIILGGFSKYAITLTDRFLDQVGADPSNYLHKIPYPLSLLESSLLLKPSSYGVFGLHIYSVINCCFFQTRSKLR